MFIDFKKYFALSALLLFICYHAGAQDFSTADSLLHQAHFDEAFGLYSSMSEQFEKDSNSEQFILCHLKMAECEIGKGEVDAGIQRAEQGLWHIRRSVQDTMHMAAMAHMVIGNGLLHIGRNDLAIEQLHLAELGFKQEDLIKAECYESIGVAYWNNENLDLALQYHEKAFEIRTNTKGVDDALLGDSNNNIGLVYLKDEPLQSNIYFERALKYYEGNHRKNRRKIALCYANISYANAELGNYRYALEYLDKMDAIWSEIYEGAHSNKAFVLNNRGRVYKMKGDLDQALEYQQQALDMHKSIHGEKHPDVANTYFLIGQIYQDKSEFEYAAMSFQHSVYSNLFDQQFEDLYSLPKVEGFYNADILLSSLQSKAKAMEALHFERTLKRRDIDAALDTYLLCDQLISAIRQTRINEVDKLRLSEIASEVYANGINLAQYLSLHTLKKREYLDIAFEFMERSKAAVLLQAINDTHAKHFSGIPDEELALEDSLKTEIDYLEQMLLQEISDEDRAKYKDHLFACQRALRGFVEGLEDKYPSYYQLKYDNKLVTAPELQAKLGEGDWLLSYFLAKDKVYIFSINARSYELIAKDLDFDLANRIKGLRNTIKYQMDEQYKEIAKELGALLIPKKFKEVYGLTVLPDGVLSTLPFESLIVEKSKESKFLIQWMAVNYDYSATLLSQRSELTSTGSKALLIAPVSFDPTQHVNDLPATEAEVREIKYLFGGSNLEVDMSVKTEASKDKVLQRLEGDYKYLHLATHGVVDEKYPDRSRIYLKGGESDDGCLYCGEIYNLKINAELVSLSACETGLGKISQGEGVIGLSRALKYAGAQNLMVSLWQVNDQSTSDLMISFYKNHLYHSDRAGFRDDLRKAKLELIASDKYSSPYYWAPFILIGQ